MRRFVIPRHVAPRARLRCLVLAALALTSTGCTTWTRVPPTAPTPRYTRLQLWYGDESILLRNVAVGPDSIVGRRLAPDTTRVAVPRSAVDSLRVPGGDVGTPLIVGTAATIVLLYAWAQGLSSE